MEPSVVIAPVDPLSAAVRELNDPLWAEIQQRYGFEAPNPTDLAAFVGPVGGFWSPPIPAARWGCGLVPVPAFGKWVDDETARCFEKVLGQR